MAVKLFEPDMVVGTFKGFTEEGLEFRAEIVFPYHPSEELTPRIGQFLLVELGNPEEAVLGRITRFFPMGIMAGPEGDEYVAEMMRESKEIPSQVKEKRLRYNVKVKLLGGLRIDKKEGKAHPKFVPTVRKLPHLGSKVALPSKEVLNFLCNLGAQGSSATCIGYYALGEIVYNGGEQESEDFLLPQKDKYEVKFDIKSLISKRSFVFARAGYGKSNLMKLLITKLYEGDGPKDKQGRPVGTLIFDPEGEYFWPDEDKRPGLCSIPHLKDKIAVFTDRPVPNPYYGSWKVGGIRLDIRELRPSDVIGICIPEDRQNQQNVAKLRGLNHEQWRNLVNYITQERHNADEVKIRQLASFKETGEGVESRAMRSNMVQIIDRLHDATATLQKQVIEMLAQGMVVIVDISLISGTAGEQVSGLLLKKIFDNNQRAFTGSEGLRIVPTIAIIEEAQSVLSPRAKEESPYVQWVKEGRKYGLGSMMVTQQPGSLAPEFLSQGDNFFTFHLLSAHDLKTLQAHNAHFSDDILASLLNEPIKGNCYFWSAPDQPFVSPARILSFEAMASRQMKPEDTIAIVETKASQFADDARKAEQKLAEILREVVVQGQVEFYGIPPIMLADNPDTAACYKPRLAACVAESLSDDLKERFCNVNPSFISDDALDQALIQSGLTMHVKKVKLNRPSKGLGDYYLIPVKILKLTVKIKETLELPKDT